MKSRESVLRLKRFQVQEKARQVAQIETMVSQFTNMAEDLDGQIAYEEKKAGIEDQTHFAYPTFAKAARLRRENLQTSILDLNEQHSAAKLALTDVEEELDKAEKLEARDGKSTAEPEKPSTYESAGMIG
ncbi:MAG: flagellar export protein FliJ [Rhizobiaceae bacterium]